MNCRRCNTPIPSRSSSCPNCGQHVGSGESFIDDPGDEGVEDVSADEQTPLGPSMLADPNMDVEIDLEDEAELSLDDAVVRDDGASRSNDASASQSGVSKPAASKPATPTRSNASKPAGPTSPAASKPATSQPSVSKPAVSRPAVSKPATPSKPAMPSKPARPTPSPSRGSGGSSSSARVLPAPEDALLPSPETVRSIVAHQPELIEPGLEVLVDDAGQEIGIRHQTDVGVIDLLARDESGALVAVMVVGPGSEGDLLGEALHRIGWVRKHLAKNGEDVRGIVLTDQLDDQVAYAAAAVSGTLRFKSYALTLSLVDLDV